MRRAAEIASAFSPQDHLVGRGSFFLVGIGGAGMSALARMLHRRGFDVRGADSTASPETARLIEDGIQVRIGHSGEGIRPGDAVVLTDAIDLDQSPEVARARDLGAPLFRRSQALGWLLRDYRVVAVTGTHGKTTTTAMLGRGLAEAGLDPVVVVGASIPDWKGPVREGRGGWAVVEACEAYDSFHDLDPQVVVLTNLELDHVDFHGTYENLRDSVLRFVNRMPEDGVLVYCEEDEGARDLASRFQGNKTPYGLADAPAEERMRLPGLHNRLNAAGCVKAAEATGAEPGRVLDGIATFGGAERRLQVLRDGDVVVVDDYAHHPTEIAASIQALRQGYPDRRLLVVYQPHLYSRTAPLIEEFGRALSGADRVVLTDIYPAREAPMPGVSSARIAEAVEAPVRYVPSRHLLPRIVAAMCRPGDVVCGMGAGNISEFAPGLIGELDRLGRLQRKVAVVYGGDSAEREVSFHSGRAVHAALERRGYESRLLDVTEILLGNGDLSPFVGPNRPDAVFLAVHGTNAEDGAIQGLFELLHIPYTGSDIQASALAMDKALTKQVLEAEGLPVPRGIVVDRDDAEVGMELPLVVKPNAQGSTVGLTFVERAEQLRPALKKALSYDREALVEEWLQGMEISVPVLGDRALPPVEIAPATGRYDFAAKYIPGATEEIVPARLPEEVLERAKEHALRAHRALGCRGATRTDMIVRGDQPVVLEVNTLPGLTSTSLLPNSARADGIAFEDLVEWMVREALERHAEKA
jgi:D-alanine--D-alanine ligase